MQVVPQKPRRDERTPHQRVRDCIEDRLHQRGIPPTRRNIQYLRDALDDGADGEYWPPAKVQDCDGDWVDWPLEADVEAADCLPRPRFVNRAQLVQWLSQGGRIGSDHGWDAEVKNLRGVKLATVHYEADGDRLFKRYSFYRAMFLRQGPNIPEELEIDATAADCLAWAAVAWEPRSAEEARTAAAYAMRDAANDMPVKPRDTPYTAPTALAAAIGKLIAYWEVL